MALPTHTKSWILQKQPETAVNFSSTADATFALKTFDIPSSIPEDSLLVKVVWLSNDAAQRGWIQKGLDPKVCIQQLVVKNDLVMHFSNQRQYMPPVKEGEVMASYAIAKVIQVGGLADTHKEGDLVYASTGWSEYSIVKKKTSRVIT